MRSLKHELLLSDKEIAGIHCKNISKIILMKVKGWEKYPILLSMTEMALKGFCKTKKNLLSDFSSSSLLIIGMEGIAERSLCSSYHPLKRVNWHQHRVVSKVTFQSVSWFPWGQCWSDSRSGLCSACQGSQSCPTGLYQVGAVVWSTPVCPWPCCVDSNENPSHSSPCLPQLILCIHSF